MAITSLTGANGKNRKRVDPTSTPNSQRPFIVRKPESDPDQHQLGNLTLAGIDQLTGMTADEIERVAEQVIDGAEETAAVLRELARRVRENGMFANERLARFVRVTNACTDIAHSMRLAIEHRDRQSPPSPQHAEATLANVADAPDLGAVEQQIEDILNVARNGVA